ncbi:MAG: hypothetical protein JSS66_07765 [Armatimonadetes bacterium]|nr:hypothetical protein [Armatimonadota bacterium]
MICATRKLAMNWHRYLTDYKCTPAVRHICELMLAAKDNESSLDALLTRANPGGWWVGTQRVNAQAAWKLVWTSMVTSLDSDWENEEIAYFAVRNWDELQQYISDPEFVPPVVAAIRAKEAQ